MGRKDDRSAEEKAAWKAGEFTEQETRDAGQDRNAMNKQREQDERELGNPLAPPE